MQYLSYLVWDVMLLQKIVLLLIGPMHIPKVLHGGTVSESPEEEKGQLFLWLHVGSWM